MGVVDPLDLENVLDRFVEICTIWVRSLFAHRPVGSYHWNLDTTQTELLIGGEDAEYDEELGRTLPRITVMRSNAAVLGTSGSQRVKYEGFGAEANTYFDNLGFTTVFRVVSRNGHEATKLGLHILFAAIAMRSDIQRHAVNASIQSNRIQITAPTKHGSVVPAAPGSEYKRVDVALPVQYAFTVGNDRTGYFAKVKDSLDYFVVATANT